MNSNKPLVSIILPVFNVEQWIEDCVRSLMEQTYQFWEAIFVIDGSLDGSASICNRYALHDSRIKVIHQENSGQGAARNYGVTKANGKYLLFLDPDDLITKNGLEMMVSRAEDVNADIVVADFYTFEDGHSPAKFHDNAGDYFNKVFGDYPTIFNRDDIDDDIFYNSLYFMVVWMKLFRAEVWSKANISAPHGMTMGEDFTTVKHMVFASKKITTVNAIIVNYRKRKGSATTQRSVKSYGIFQAYHVALDMYNELNIGKHEIAYLHKCFMYWYLNHLYDFTPVAEFSKFYKRIRSELKLWDRSLLNSGVFSENDLRIYNRIINCSFLTFLVSNSLYFAKHLAIQSGVSTFRTLRLYLPLPILSLCVKSFKKVAQLNISPNITRISIKIVKHLTTG
jgi:glycosyltransferase involved in cell wall biosynthesis